MVADGEAVAADAAHFGSTAAGFVAGEAEVAQVDLASLAGQSQKVFQVDAFCSN